MGSLYRLLLQEADRTGNNYATWPIRSAAPPRNLAFSRAVPHKIARFGAGQFRGFGMADFAASRRMMVDGQVRTNDVTDLRLITAMLEVPRERFVPRDLQPLAYLDRDLEVGAGRALVKPMVLATLRPSLMAQRLAPLPRWATIRRERARSGWVSRRRVAM